MKKFTEDKKSTFLYWVCHWLCFQYVAIKLHVWMPWYIFHDIEKPLLMWMWKDYPKVRNWHRKHHRHHMEYDNGTIAPWLYCDYTGMVVDWECSHYTKMHAQLNAYEECCRLLEEAFEEKNPLVIHQLYNYYFEVLQNLKLVPDEFYTSDLYKKLQDKEWTKWDGREFYLKRYGRPAPTKLLKDGAPYVKQLKKK